jgi:coenzyme PQQ synthesis protein D (PqqD)
MGSTRSLPRARTDKLVVHALPDETLVYDLTSHKAHCLNQTAAAVWARCDGRTTVGEMASRLGQQANAPVHEDVVWLALEQLENVHLLQEEAPKPGAGAAMSRRKLVQKLGLGAAVAIPAVVSILAPEAAQAATQLANGSRCTSNSECASGCCKQNTNPHVCASPGQGTQCV